MTPESVRIEFNGREFGWLVPASHPGEPESGPTVTTLVDRDVEDAWLEASEATQRFISALAFHFDTRMETPPTSGGSGEIDLLHPWGAVDVRDTYGIELHVAPRSVVVADDSRLRLALALYREGLNAGSPFYRFLAFWNALDAAFDGDESARDEFLGTGSRWHPHYLTEGVATHLRMNSRHAIAHVIREAGRTVVDPDIPADRERLDLEGRQWLRDLARNAIESTWPPPVRTT
jgi:hypothetical protein